MKDIEGRRRTMCAFWYWVKYSRSRYLGGMEVRRRDPRLVNWMEGAYSSQKAIL